MTDAPDQPRRTRIDWPLLRKHYVEGTAVNPDGDPDARNWPSIDELAALHGVNRGTVGRRSSREHWPQQREQLQIEVDRRRRERLADERASQAANVDRRGLSAADAGLALVGHRLAFMLQRAQQQPANGRASDLHARELATLGLAAWRFVRTKEAVLGSPTSDEPVSDAQLEREQRVEEELLAARMALRSADRLRDDDALDAAEGVSPAGSTS